jgi:hypothetical protein
VIAISEEVSQMTSMLDEVLPWARISVCALLLLMMLDGAEGGADQGVTGVRSDPISR